MPSSIDLAAAEIELVSVMGREMICSSGALRRRKSILTMCFWIARPRWGCLRSTHWPSLTKSSFPCRLISWRYRASPNCWRRCNWSIRRMNPKLTVSGIVLTMFESQTKLSLEVVAELNEFIQSAAGKPLPWAGARIFRSRIRRNIKLAESPSFGQTILNYDSNSHGATDYRALAAEVAEMQAPYCPPAAPPAATARRPRCSTSRRARSGGSSESFDRPCKTCGRPSTRRGNCSVVVAARQRLTIESNAMSSSALYAPWRMEYIKSLSKPDPKDNKTCFLCEAAAASNDESRRQLLVLWQTDLLVVLMNRYPYANGHLLVAPKAHKSDLEELTEAEHVRSWARRQHKQ